MHLQIHMTDKCNSHCPYCYIKQENNRDLTLENLSEQLVIVKDLKQRYGDISNYQVTYFGGEPLLMYDNILKFDEYIKSQMQVEKSFIQTNGSLLNKDIIQELNKRDFHIGVSCDGINDEHYKYYIELRKQGLIHIQPKMIVSPYNVKNMMINIDFFHRLALKTNDYQYYYDVSFVKEDVWQDLTELKNQLVNLKQYIIEYYKFNGGWVRLGFVERILQNVIIGKRNYICFAGHNGCSITPKGVYPCSRFYSHDFDVLWNKNGYNIDNIQFVYDNNRTVNDKCNDCSISTICNQGCLFNQLKSGLATSYCDLLKCLYHFATDIYMVMKHDYNYNMLGENGEWKAPTK